MEKCVMEKEEQFEVSIQLNENATWEGTIEYKENEYLFQSELEFLMLISRLLEQNEGTKI